MEGEKGGLSDHINNAVKVIRAAKFAIVSFDAVRGDCIRMEEGAQGTCVDLGTVVYCTSLRVTQAALLWGGT